MDVNIIMLEHLEITGNMLYEYILQNWREKHFSFQSLVVWVITCMHLYYVPDVACRHFLFCRSNAFLWFNANNCDEKQYRIDFTRITLENLKYLYFQLN